MSTMGFSSTETNWFQGLDEVLSPWVTNGAALGTLITCFAYGVLVAGVRWYMIARPARKLLIARIDDDIAASASHIEEDDVALIEAKNLLVKAKTDIASGLWAAIGWSGADESSGWRHVYAAERTLLSVWPADRVRVRLLETRDKLVEILGAKAVEFKLVQAIDEAERADPPNDDRCRALLDEALGIVRDAETQKTIAIYTWQNKAMLMVGMGLMLITIIAGTLGKPALLLVGAVGGFLSRLSKIMRSDRAQSGHGAHWTTIFLSPLLGALAGWSGILLASLAQQLGLLGQSLQFIGWTNNWGNPGTLGLAFLLGFSERYFNDVATNIEHTTVPVQARSSGFSSSTTKTPKGNGPAASEMAPSKRNGGAPNAPAATNQSPATTVVSPEVASPPSGTST